MSVLCLDLASVVASLPATVLAHSILLFSEAASLIHLHEPLQIISLSCYS